MDFIGLGASLLGGLFGRSAERKAIREQNAYNDPAAIRARAEAAGFNPLLFMGPGVGNQTAVGGSNFMGSAIADAGMMLSDRLAKRQDLIKASTLEAENKALSRKVEKLTLRPKVGGLYSQPSNMPSRMAALGGASASVGGSPSVGSVPVPDRFLDRASGVYVAGEYYAGAPGWSDSQTIEDNYGDILGAVHGFAKLGADTAHRHNMQRRGDAIVQNISPRGDMFAASRAFRKLPSAYNYHKGRHRPGFLLP